MTTATGGALSHIPSSRWRGTDFQRIHRCGKSTGLSARASMLRFAGRDKHSAAMHGRHEPAAGMAGLPGYSVHVITCAKLGAAGDDFALQY
jgi:hypothetical protein